MIVSFDKPRTLNVCASLCQRMIPVSFSRVNTVQARALICLNNIVSALDTGLLGGQEVLAQLWTSLFSLTFESKGMLSCRSLKRVKQWRHARHFVRHAVSPERLRDLQQALSSIYRFQGSGPSVSFYTSFLVRIVLGACPFNTFPPWVYEKKGGDLG